MLVVVQRSFLFLLSITFILSCSPTDPYNSLTKEEKENGWQLLFDGTTMKGWHPYNHTAMPPVWQVKNGELQCIRISKNISHADLVSDAEFENFDLRFEWKIQKGGNSGVMINVQEDTAYANTYFTGPEYQMLDDEHDDVHHGKPTEISGSVYGVVPHEGASKPKPFGEWNQSRIVQEHGKITFWLNGIVSATADINRKEWNDLVAQSPLHFYADFGKKPKGRIALQDHIDEVAFRAIKIKGL